MNDLVRTLIAGAVGSALTLAVVAGPPALADGVEKVKGKKVTSAQIKDGTIQGKDLNGDVNGALDKARSALQGIPDNAVTTGKIANNAVTSGKIADNGVTGPDIADNAVGAGEVTNGSLSTSDIAIDHGTTTIDFASIGAHSCLASTAIGTLSASTFNLIMVQAPGTVAGAINVFGRWADPANFVILACNSSTVALDPGNSVFSWAILKNS